MKIASKCGAASEGPKETHCARSSADVRLLGGAQCVSFGPPIPESIFRIFSSLYRLNKSFTGKIYYFCLHFTIECRQSNFFFLL